MKISTILSIILCLVLCQSVDAGIHKKNLKILYVGGTPDFEYFVTSHDSTEIAESAKKRMHSFEKLLKYYFKQVTVVHANDYTVDMSDNYDVTIMDGVPRPIEPERLDKNGYRVRAKYVPDDFSRPMLMIAQMTDEIGAAIGLKMDAYCHCLYGHAHHIRMEHSVFKGPFPVKMTIKTEETPEAGKKMYYPFGEKGVAPDSLPMWQVQKRSYLTHPGMRIGLITHPGGFEDSPEAEFISGGVSGKGLHAVAIGRHGNFLHWGFAASPDDMTEEAKNVFANAIVYISQFAGQTPIARKYRGMATREFVGWNAFNSSDKAYRESLKFQESLNKSMEELKQKAMEKRARGEKLERYEEIHLKWEYSKPLTYDEYLQKEFGDLYLLFGTDEKGYWDYFTNNYPYFIPKNGTSTFLSDEDVRSLGIPTNDIRLLDKAISLWETGEDITKARRLLTRYTLCRFGTPEDWRAWYETNEKRLFFTEAGGWVFMVNTRDKNVPGNDYSVWEKEEQAKMEPTPLEECDEKNPVKAFISADTLPNGNRLVTIRLKICKGYHIYAHVADMDPFLPVKVDFRLDSGISRVGDLQSPASEAYNSAGTLVYKNEVLFRQEFSGSGMIVCLLRYQCCNDQICMPPSDIELEIE